jgi:hypothetical protein
VLAYATSHLSGGQMNPAVTLGLVLAGSLGPVQGAANMVAQVSMQQVCLDLSKRCWGLATAELILAQQEPPSLLPLPLFHPLTHLPPSCLPLPAPPPRVTPLQLAGAILGASFLFATIPNSDSSALGSNAPAPGVSVGNAIMGEIVMTFVLVSGWVRK